MTHTQETGKSSDNPNWLPVDQCGFGEQFMHLSKLHMVLQVRVFHIIRAGCEASARSENRAV
jgi:hypothetical protein